MKRVFLVGVAVLLCGGSAQGQGCNGGSYGGYAYGGGYGNGFARGYQFGSYGLPPAAYGYSNGYGGAYAYEPPPPAVYESRTPYFDRPAVNITFDQRGARFGRRRPGSFAAPSRPLFDARVRVGGRDYCPGGY